MQSQLSNKLGNKKAEDVVGIADEIAEIENKEK